MNNRFKISIAQIAPRFGDIDANLKKHHECIELAKKQNSQLIIFPELAITGYSLKDMTTEMAVTTDDKIFDSLKDESRDIAIITSFVELGDDMISYISTAMFYDGKLQQIYKKVHPPTHGMFEELKNFGSGESIQAIDSPFGRIGLMICRDIWHPELAYVLSVDGALLMIASSAIPARNISGDRFGVDESMTRTMSNMAATNQVWTVLCNRVGVEEGVTFLGGSIVCSPNGAVVCKMPLLEESIETVEINLDEIRRSRDALNLVRERKNRLILSELERILKK